MKTTFFLCLFCFFTTSILNNLFSQNVKKIENQLDVKCGANDHFFWSKVLQRCVDSTTFDMVLFPYAQDKAKAIPKELIGLIFDSNLQKVEVFSSDGSLVLFKNELRQSYESIDQNIILRQKNGTWFYSEIKTGAVAQSVKLYASN